MAIKDEKPDLLTVMQQAGVVFPRLEGRRSMTVRCPFHEDRGRPNLAVWPASGRWRCFRCDVGGDVFDFAGLLVYGASWNNRDKEMFKEVLRRLNIQNIPKQRLLPAPISAPRLEPRQIQVLELASRVYHLSLMSASGKAVREKLAERGLDGEALRRYRVGYAAPGALIGVMAGFPPELKQVVAETGLFHEAREWLAGRIIFPDVGRGGSVLHMIGRATGRQARLRYLGLPGLPKTIWGLDNARRSAPVILTESIIDAINLRQMGFQGVAVNGTGLALPLAEKLRRVPDLGILPQADEAGSEAVARWLELLPGARVLSDIPWGKMPGGAPQKDLNDLWVAEGRKRAFQVIHTALGRAGFKIQMEEP